MASWDLMLYTKFRGITSHKTINLILATLTTSTLNHRPCLPYKTFRNEKVLCAVLYCPRPQ
jgi:hypothetical protein